jgi:hypothetical protein
VHITAYSYDAGGRIEFYCYLKSASGVIAEAVGKSFLRALARAMLKIYRKGGQPSAPTKETP